MTSLVQSSRSAYGVADQLLSSATNYLTAFIASLVLTADAFGAFVVAYAVVTIYSAGVRAVVGEPVLAHLPTVGSPDEESRLAGSALGTAGVLGVAGSVLALAVAALGSGSVTELAWFAPWLIGALVADAGRFVLLARSRTGAALLVDGAWAIAQGAVLVVVAVLGAWSVLTTAAAWGIGALVAVATLFAVGMDRPRAPKPWLHAGRHLSGWFTLTSLLGQIQVYAVLLLAGAVLAASEMAGLRAVQLLVFQPAVTLFAAVMVLTTPRFARLAADRDTAGLARLQRLSLICVTVLGLLALVAIPLRGFLLDLLFPRYLGFAALVAPIALQTLLSGLSVPYQARLRGMQRGRLLFLVQVAGTVLMVAGALAGLALHGVLGIAWGMSLAALLTTAVTAVVAERTRPPVAVPA
ncbi:O-antigen/teichoic acid export membrane protein [Pseudonocardia sediminis]|uniref:O-antigen/teichoic acid export membrane protein n=1 Tax=Pseudonocardia sediminis TaxID=1397368 RepID=A0A4V2FRA6_PSEST|nr:hypothetical protein [Pseudonocardia sediminis]RZT87900.1 O-antigen/teichoic acid export membrane protein [Pseudonocardia sediminis]